MKTLKTTERKYYKYDYTKPHINGGLIGALTINGSEVSGFSNSAYIAVTTFNPANKPYEIVIKFQTNSPSTQKNICGGNGTSTQAYVPQLRIYSSKLYFYSPSGTDIVSSSTLSANTWYWAKMIWTGTQKQLWLSTNGSDYTLEGTVDTTAQLTGGVFWLGGAYGAGSYLNFSTGTIDMAETYMKINGEYIFKGATYPAVESTSSDYDFYKDVDVYKPLKNTERKYYKYQDSAWAQPVITYNGIMGETGFATSAAYESYTKSYNAIIGNAWTGPVGSGRTSWYKFFNYTPLKVTQVTWYNIGGAYYNLIGGTFEGSNDDENWTVLGQIDNVNTANALRTITISNPNYYHYYKWNITNISANSNGYTRYGYLKDIQITATQLLPVESTSSDYDFYEDVDVYKALVA